MICALHVTQSPPDHYLLPEVANKAINNIRKISTYLSEDTIYLNQINLPYFINNGIDRLIPTRKQSQEKIGQLNTNQFHKDHFFYISDLNLFMYPAEQPMYFYKEYTQPSKNSDKPDKIKRIYNNYDAYKTCIHRNVCLTETHKTITENDRRLERVMFFKMKKEEYKKEFSKRPSVEGPFTIFKEQYHIEQEK